MIVTRCSRFAASLVALCCMLDRTHAAEKPNPPQGRVNPPEERVNILYIFTDDQSTRSVSCYEGARPWARTPNIDKLADSGMRFTTCYTGTWCQPSRASALSGLLQHATKTLRITDYPMAAYNPEQLRFFPSVFRKHGYQTACIGKWHLGDDVGHGRDWDYSVIWDRGGGNAHAYYNGTLVRTNGGERKPLGGYSTDRYTELAVDYIKGKQRDDKPWYLWLCYGGVHGPYTPAQRHGSAYADAPASEIPVDIFGPRPSKPAHLRNLTRWRKDKNGNPKGYDQAVKKYHKAVKSLDDGVGALVRALKESGQLQNTVIIFTSDQGFAWGQHGSKEKWMPYDANICAPLIFSAPGLIKPGTLCREPVNGVDVVSTIHALAGIEPEWEMHGRDLSGLLESPEASLAEPMLMINTTYEYGESIVERLKAKDYDAFERRGLYAWMMMRDGSYKYIRHFKDNVIEELYDLEQDPEELNNLAVSPEYRKTLAELRRKAMQEFRKKDGDFVDHLPEPRECEATVSDLPVAANASENLADTPPMGWNSFDSYSCHLYEEVALKELDVFIRSYAPHGYEYYVIDNGWFAEHERIEGTGEAAGLRLPLRQHAEPSDVRINEYGIVQPSAEGFPNGFKPLVDRLHARGLKFGLHIMRGIPRKAVEQNTPIKGTKFHARDIANVRDNCGWCAYMHGVDMGKPGSQAYYNSLVQQFADWGVDFIKVDDVIHKPREIEAYRKAIDQCGRPILLSLSPGNGIRKDLCTTTYRLANMIRITSDVWDKPHTFKKHLDRYKSFGELSGPGMWVDLDMLAVGELCLLHRPQNYDEATKRGLSVKETRFSGHGYHWCRFNRDQKSHFLALRSISCSPLMIGGALTSMDEESRTMITDPEFIACNQNGIPATVVFEKDSVAVLSTPKKNSSTEGWMAILNTGADSQTVDLTPTLLGHDHAMECERIWDEGTYHITSEGLAVAIPGYGAIFLKYKIHR